MALENQLKNLGGGGGWTGRGICAYRDILNGLCLNRTFDDTLHVFHSLLKK